MTIFDQDIQNAGANLRAANPLRTLYVLTMDYTSPDKTSTPSMQGGAYPQYSGRTFYSGEEVLGERYIPDASVNFKFAPSIIVDGKYIIPLSVLQEKETVIALPTTAEINNLASSAKSSKGFKNGVLIGVCAGVAIGFIRNKSVFIHGLVGMMVGGTVGYIITNQPSVTPATA